MVQKSALVSETEYDDSIDFKAVTDRIVRNKWLILILASAMGAASLVYAVLEPNVYRSQVVLAPTESDPMGGLAGIASQFGGLAGLAGVNLGSGSKSQTKIGLEILKSRQFITSFIEQRNILVPLMAAKGWDPETGAVELDTSIYDPESSKWTRTIDPPRTRVPSSQEAFEEFSEIVSVTEDNKTGMIVLEIEHFSPNLASEWANWLVADINATVMRKDVSKAEQAIEYLNAQVEKTSLAELRSVFYRLIEEQMKTIMLASASNEYLFETIDPAISPELKSGPNRKLIVLVGSLFGFFSGIIISLLRRPGS